MKAAAKIKESKLYAVRHHPMNGAWSGRTVGHKARLLPYKAAQRVAKRLRKAGLFITTSPLIVNTTPEQREYLNRRYA
jgi:hypothetical protein